MIKQELIEAVAAKTGANEYETRKAIEATLDTIKEALTSGEDVTLRGFGTFKVKTRAPKSVRNINTGEQYTIASTRRVVFTSYIKPE